MFQKSSAEKLKKMLKHLKKIMNPLLYVGPNFFDIFINSSLFYRLNKNRRDTQSFGKKRITHSM